MNAVFELGEFIAECRRALKQAAGQTFVHEVVARAVSSPAEVLKELGEPKRAEIQTLCRSDDLTVLNVIWGPHMTLLPHDHHMWAIIGIYTGREDNIFWRRVAGSPGGKLEAAGARALCEKDAEPLGRDIIHSVTNPIARLTGAIHVYGGIFSPFRAASGIRNHFSNSAMMWTKLFASLRNQTHFTATSSEHYSMEIHSGNKTKQWGACFSERWLPGHRER